MRTATGEISYDWAVRWYEGQFFWFEIGLVFMSGGYELRKRGESEKRNFIFYKNRSILYLKKNGCILSPA